ncbi:hypothetical protein [Bacteroides acidifaciens]|uniref:hypothetical protein n=1 Tax=Bacteroides acidifaciens TaxID=85831 RepID=UPI0025ADA688|nr:hypothetical protein [Bacteroides acidifaciens]
MAEYTMYIRDVVRMVNGNISKDMDSDIKTASDKIFSFDYPIWADGYKEELQRKFIERFYMREICAETYPMWKLMLKRHMQIRMPYYNNLYKTTLYEFDPTIDFDMVTTHRGSDTRDSESSDVNTMESTGTDTGTTTTSSTGTENGTDARTDTKNTSSSTEKDGTDEKTSSSTFTPDSLHRIETDKDVTNSNLESDFPNATFGGMSNYASEANAGEVHEHDVVNDKHSGVDKTNGTENGSFTENVTVSGTDSTEIRGTASKENVSHGTSETNSSNKNNSSSTASGTFGERGTNEYETRVKGNDGKYTLAYLLKEYRDVIINIDELFLQDCEKLFMSIW